jgi:nucleoside-diphosphate-sugar epimerase
MTLDGEKQLGQRLRYDGLMMVPRPLIILGCGYSGRWIYRLAKRRSPQVLASSRQPEGQLSTVDPQDRLRFDLADSSTWSALPPGADLIWTFPAAPLELVQAFADRQGMAFRRLVVLGSTSAYALDDVPSDSLPPWLDESAPIDTGLSRVQGEEYLRVRHGAIILRVAGIYGPNRNPVDWIRQGLVGPTDKFVNLIHVEDLAHLCLLALKAGQPGQTYNVSDGRPRRWADICAEISRKWGIISPRQADSYNPGKRILSDKVFARFGHRLRHPDLYRALASIETGIDAQD